jgi:hypothetical protein
MPSAAKMAEAGESCPSYGSIQKAKVILVLATLFGINFYIDAIKGQASQFLSL